MKYFNSHSTDRFQREHDNRDHGYSNRYSDYDGDDSREREYRYRYNNNQRYLNYDNKRHYNNGRYQNYNREYDRYPHSNYQAQRPKFVWIRRGEKGHSQYNSTHSYE
ncbi:hypothetical protein RF11_11696 [Thelohanellus kitauei]|uniref:Uncharacterized protein n=1 Tax=Thelohanellus kitauei TaxID=669202 RepID=A0A0C2MLK4_THEKT|nr:hypothetical protein RF11_11696 [Thelohanellus kitauei]